MPEGVYPAELTRERPTAVRCTELQMKGQDT